MTKIAIKTYPEAYHLAQAISGHCPLVFPLNVSQLLDTITTHTIYDLSSWNFNQSFAQNSRETLHPKKAWAIYNEHMDTYLIVWNRAQARASIRYSIAHELGHILLNHERTWPMDRTLKALDKENEADTFARCLLAPFERVQALCKNEAFNARLVASYFDIPYRAAAKIRCDYAYWLLNNA